MNYKKTFGYVSVLAISTFYIFKTNNYKFNFNNNCNTKKINILNKILKDSSDE